MPVLNQDEFFSPLENTKPYLKVAFEGFAGSGKTYTLAQLAIGLWLLLKERTGAAKPIIYFDTEHAAKFLRHLFDAAGIPVLVKESRSLADLKETMARCRNGLSDILLIDSISHLWEDYLESYKTKMKRTRLEFQDWGVIKPTWKREFSEPLVRDPVHILFTGRAGYEYEQEKDDNGKKQIVKSGIKMRVEGETAYEPDILVLMERFEEVLGDEKKVWREATIIKDRSTLIDGKTFKNPTVADFMPAIDRCLAAPAAATVQPERDTAELFHTEEDKREWFQKRDIALEKLEAVLTSAFPGQSAEAKKHKVDSLAFAYGTTSWTEISKKLAPELITAGFVKIDAYIAEQKAKAEVA